MLYQLYEAQRALLSPFAEFASAAGQLNFHGNVEGNDIYKGTTDLVVCDGFVGNVLLKTSEGLAGMMGDFIKDEFSRNQAGGTGGDARAQALQAPRGPPPLQWRGLAGFARIGLQESWVGRCRGIRECPGARL
mgnify:CR=1 FL=1